MYALPQGEYWGLGIHLHELACLRSVGTLAFCYKQTKSINQNEGQPLKWLLCLCGHHWDTGMSVQRLRKMGWSSVVHDSKMNIYKQEPGGLGLRGNNWVEEEIGATISAQREMKKSLQSLWTPCTSVTSSLHLSRVWDMRALQLSF